MNTFGSKLNEYLDILGITQVKAAQIAGCSRAMIYAVLNDERNLAENKFLTMLAEIPFSETQADVLRKLYYADKYPKGVIEKILCIKKNLSDPQTVPTGRQMPAAIPLPDGQTTVNGEHDLCALAAAMLADDACRQAVTNFSYRAENFDHAVYAALCKRKTPIDFQHVICFENSNRTTVNIQNIFSSVRYIRLRHSPLYYYVEDIPRRYQSLYPQFLITDRAILLFHEKLNIGIYLTSPAVIEDTTAAIGQFLLSCKPLAQISQNILELKDTLLKNSDNHILNCIANFACDLQNANHAFFDALTRPDLPDREILIQIAETHYAQYGQPYEDFFLPLRAIEKFAREGLTPNFPQNWTVPLPYEYRIEVLKRFRERVSRSSNRLILLKDSLLQFPDELWGIDIGENHMGFFGSISADGSQYAGEYGITTQNRNIIADFRFYLDYITRNKLFYSPEYAEAIIDAQILECERLKNQSK